MSNEIIKLFKDKTLIEKIQRKLPHLFQLAELESSRSGKVGMEVGSVREKIITALLIYKFGEENVETEIPITEAEIIDNNNTLRILINWKKELIDFKPFARWVELWQMD